MHYGKGFGTQMADYRWFCSWSSRAVSETLPPRARRAALEQLAKLRDPAFVEHMTGSQRQYAFVMVAEALRGKAQDLRDYVSACRSHVDQPIK